MRNKMLAMIESAAEELEKNKAQSRQLEIQKALQVLESAICFDGFINDEIIEKVLIKELPDKILSLPLSELPAKDDLRKFFKQLREKFERLFNPPYVKQETELRQNEKIFFDIRDEILELLKNDTSPKIPKIIRKSYIQFTKNYMAAYWGKM